MDIESASVSVNASAKAISTLLSTPANLRDLLPADRIENWSSSASGCAFQIKGLAYIQLQLSEVTEHSITYKSIGEKPFAFRLTINLNGHDDHCHVSVKLHAEVNTFMAMMLQSPLSNFVQMLAEALRNKF